MSKKIKLPIKKLKFSVQENHNHSIQVNMEGDLFQLISLKRLPKLQNLHDKHFIDNYHQKDQVSVQRSKNKTLSTRIITWT